jgi:hypothetical protein
MTKTIDTTPYSFFDYLTMGPSYSVVKKKLKKKGIDKNTWKPYLNLYYSASLLKHSIFLDMAKKNIKKEIDMGL